MKLRVAAGLLTAKGRKQSGTLRVTVGEEVSHSAYAAWEGGSILVRSLDAKGWLLNFKDL